MLLKQYNPAADNNKNKMLQQVFINTEQYIINYLRMQIHKAIIGGSMENQKKFNMRAFVSIGMFLSCLGLPYSGIMNHELGFNPMSPERHIWMSVHNILGFLFVIFSVSHIWLNWRILKNHLKNAAGFIINKEAVYAVALVGGLLTLAILHGMFLNR